MYLFVIGNFRRFRRRPQRAGDEIPTAPLVEALLFWTLFGIGALSGAVAIAGAYVSEGDTATRVTTLVAAASCAGCFAGAWAMWRRLLR